MILADGSEARLPAAELGLAYRESRFKHQADPATREVVVGATIPPRARTGGEIKARLDDIRRWRQAHQPLGIPSAGSVFRNPPTGACGRTPDRRGRPEGLPDGGATVSQKHANFIVNDRTRHGRRRPAPGRSRPGDDPRDRRRRPSLRSRVRRRLDRLAVAGRRCRRRRRHVTTTPPTTRPSSSCSAGRRPSTTSRSCPGPRSPTALLADGLDVRQVLIDLDGTLVVAARRPRRRDRPAAAYDDPAALGADGPVTVGAALDRLAARAARHRSSSSPCTARSARTARSRRCSRPPGSRTRARASSARRWAWTRSRRSGSGAASACRSSTGWRFESPAGWRIAPPCSASSRRSPPERGDPRLMVKPARLGSSVGMTLAHAPDERAAGPRPGLPVRRPRDRRDVPRRRARPRDLGDRDRAAARGLRPGRDRGRPRVLRLRGEVHAGAVRDHDAGGGVRDRSGPRSASSPATPTARSARRASLGSTSWSAATSSTCRRSTRSPASRRSACSRRCRPRPASTSPPSACASSSWRWSDTRAAGRLGSPRATCRDEGAPVRLARRGARP